jgi:hypothetical protein
MTIALERRLANYRSGLAASSPGQRESRALAVAIGAERLAAEVDGELVRVERPSAVIAIDRARLATLPGQPAPDVPLLCLDTETTGLATAAGTLAFLVGLGWWEGARFRQVQLLLPDHADEPAFLDELRRHIPVHGWLVTYNGRGFDWPLLVARYRMARTAPPPHAGHLDLLPLVRRVFRHRMPDARLQTAEAHLLGLRRHEDVAGWEIPSRYLQFLRDGDPALLLAVVRHNDEDVRSLARLLAHVDERLADLLARRVAPAGDLAGLGRSYAADRRFDEALECVDIAIDGLEQGIADRPFERAELRDRVTVEPHRVREDDDAWWSPRRRPDFGGRAIASTAAPWRAATDERLTNPWTRERLEAERGRLLRRLGRRVEAESAWLVVADRGGLLGALAWIEIAKIREHDRRDPEAAMAATLAALRYVERSRTLGRAHGRLERDLVRRASRLRRRITRHRSGTGPARLRAQSPAPRGSAVPSP